jgi:GTPase
VVVRADELVILARSVACQLICTKGAQRDIVSIVVVVRKEASCSVTVAVIVAGKVRDGEGSFVGPHFARPKLVLEAIFVQDCHSSPANFVVI